MRRLNGILLALVLTGLLVYLTSGFWLTWLGNSLIYTSAPVPSEAVVVLAGDYTGSRILKGAELVRQGLAPVVLVSGPLALYGRTESSLAVEYAIAKGCPREWFREVPLTADSTVEEANALVRTLRVSGIQRVLVVTSDYHTRRAAAVWRKYAPEIQFQMIAAPSKEFQIYEWWKTRPGRKAIYLEWTKSLAWRFGI